jgi:hypothetical protein
VPDPNQAQPPLGSSNNYARFCLCVKNGPCGCGLIATSSLVEGNPIPAPGTLQNYTIEIALRACTNVFGITAVGTVPGFTEALPPPGSTVTTSGLPSAPTLTWNIPFLPAGQTRTLLVRLRVTIPKNCPIPPTAQSGPFMLTQPWNVSFFANGLKCFTTTTPVFVNVICQPSAIKVDLDS